MNVTWHGIYPAATTHFHNDQSLDLPGTLQHLDAMLAAGIDGVIMLGTVGENCSLEYREKLDVLKATVALVFARRDAGVRAAAVLSSVAVVSLGAPRRFLLRPVWANHPDPVCSR